MAPANATRLLFVLLLSGRLLAGVPFIRGDVDASGGLSIADPLRLLGFLFLGKPATLECSSAADSDDNGLLDVSDAVHSLSFLFLGSLPPPAPFPGCDADPTPDSLSCAAHAACPVNRVATGGWPMGRHDAVLSGRASVSGRLREAPGLLWTFRDDILEVELELAPGTGGSGAGLVIEPSKLPLRWTQLGGAPLVDLHGDGRLVPDPGKAARLVPGLKGLQTVSFEPVPGAEATLTRKAVCYAYDAPSPRVIWTSEAFDTIQNTNHIVADVDADGQLEVVLAPHYRVIILDGATGRTEHVLRFHDLRNYGFLSAVNLDADPMLELVVIADFALHVDVIDMDAMGPALLWRRDFEEDIQSKQRIVRPGPDPVVDLDGDERKEIVFNLYNDANDGLWHVIALDALTGEQRVDLKGLYLQGHEDLDGDGAQELLVTECPSIHVPQAGTVRVLSWRQGETPPLVDRWSMQGTRFLAAEVPLPLARSTIVARGTEAAFTLGMGPGGPRAFAVASRDVDRELLRLVAPGRSDPILEAAFPAERDLSIRGVVDAATHASPAVCVTLRARPAERLELTAPVGGEAKAVAVHRVASRPARGTAADGWLAVGSWAGQTAVFAENELGEVLALRPGRAATPSIVWRDRGRGPVILADVDGDGADEAVFAGESPDGEGQIAAAGPAGRKWTRPIAGFPGPNPVWNYGGVTQWWVGRFTARDRFDVFVSARRGTMHTDEGFMLRGADGFRLWRRAEVRTPDMPPATRGWGCGGGALNSIDVDGDGFDDVLSLYPVNFWVARGMSGEIIRSINAASGLFPGVWGAYATPCTMDLDGDGRREILWSGPYHQAVTDLDGKVRWFLKGATSVATACDLDGDGRLEVASTGWESGGQGLRVLDARTGDLRWALQLGGNPRVSVTAAQLDGEGGEELLFATGTTLRAVTFRAGALRQLWSVSIPSAPLGEVAFADTDGDGQGEVLFVGRDGTLYCYGAN